LLKLGFFVRTRYNLFSGKPAAQKVAPGFAVAILRDKARSFAVASFQFRALARG
jgi:hypothetical protein